VQSALNEGGHGRDIYLFWPRAKLLQQEKKNSAAAQRGKASITGFK
jgi:hypothetical protein